MKKIYPYIDTVSTRDETPLWGKRCSYIINKTPKKCPVCEGSGKYEKVRCHGCEGKGWVVVDESYIDMKDS